MTTTTPARTCRWEFSPEDTRALLAGYQSAPLVVTVGEEVTTYHVQYDCGPGGRPSGFNLTRERPDMEVETYHVDLSFGPDPVAHGACNCPHSTYRPAGKPCRHRAALRAALVKIGLLESDERPARSA